ncbi:ATP-binding cassette domain-containing protein [Natronococcus sp. A-GB1]|uniref:ABC transporter ATP-binding protein n=1 Tax=Natronococcus sp. A-GB1 TaxID=3037648 RepID=UPI00242027F0|nr:ATP-binding cassette domain-containing protein [Natronococcus sp. A-GB1]MDG5761574.1 ATP-binding cassette domain-containing protein [Natronococcus sp. A-GB1]
MGDPVLTADSVSVRRGGQAILEELSLSIPRGSRTLVCGPSGAGKSTLFAVLGLLDSPDRGRVLVDGTDASELSERRRARLRREVLGLVFQTPQLVPALSARENALLPQSHGGTRDEAWVDELLARLAVADRADRCPAALSVGERRRVAIARALANRPAVVVADEPTAQLEPEAAERVLELLCDIQATTDAALVAISHDPSLGALFERTATLHDGSVANPP